MSETRRIDIGGHTIHAVHSPRAGPAERHFLCLHGLVDDVNVWRRIAPELERRGRVTRIDQRGHGESDSPAGPYSRDDLARDVIGVLDAERIEPAILVGHSMGGIVAMAAALAAPKRVAGLVLIGTTSECREKVALWYERIALAGEKDGIDGIRRSIYGAESTKQIAGDAQGIAHVTRMLKSLFDDPLTPKLGEISCPALLLVGEKDPMGPKASEIIRNALPPENTDFESIPDKGHWLQLEAPDEVISSLDAWLARFEL